MAKSATLTFGYKDTDFTRQYTFDGLTEAQCTGLKAKVLSLNSSISGGLSAAGLEAAAGLSSFFISDDFDATEGIGYFTGIVAAHYKSETVTEIDLT